jgi:tetratricopeptide (TPR) repeat protein
VALLAGCATQTAALRQETPAALAAPLELTATPFVPQTRFHCGPAALATALGAAGLPADVERLGDEIFLPARSGTLQVEVVAGARRAGAVATRIPSTLEAALRELHAGHPVLVLQNLGLSFAPTWHYAVLIGADVQRGEVVLRSGTIRREVMPMRTFEHTWMRAGGWGLVVLPPGRWPQTSTPAAVIEAAVGYERVAPGERAAAVYRSALERIGPDLTLAMGLGNSLYAAGDLRGAEAAFADAARRFRSAPAGINLARTRLALGDAEGARAAADAAAAVADAAWAAPLAALRQELAQTKDSSPRR